MQWSFQWEESFLLFLQEHARSPWLDKCMNAVTRLGDAGFIAICACLALLAIPSLRWIGKTQEETARILQAFDPEYISVRYPDKKSGAYETRVFYTGDRTAPVKTWWAGKKIIESISFDIIER